MTSHPVPDAALESDIAILGKKGRGKSFTARGLVERLLDKGRRVIVLDPLSTWWGLKAGPNAYPIPVLGGPQADLPLPETSGAELGRYLAKSDQSVVIDVGEFRKRQLIRFAEPFLEELYTHNRDPLWLVLEEADVFAPQQPMPETAQMLGEVDRIARRGRQFGFRLISLTQRPARLNKDVLTQLSTLIALGLTGPLDRKAVQAWVEGAGDRGKAKEVLSTLASLRVGEGWVWAPDQDLLKRVTFPGIKTLDTSATPKAGEARPAGRIRKDMDLDALRHLFAEAVVADGGKDNVGRSTSPPAASANRAADPNEIAAAEARGYERGFKEGARMGSDEAHRLIADIKTAYETAEKRLHSPWFEHDARFRGGALLLSGPRTELAQDAPGRAQEEAASGKNAPEEPNLTSSASLSRVRDLARNGRAASPAAQAHIDAFAAGARDRSGGGAVDSRGRVAAAVGGGPAADDLPPALQRALDAIAWWRAAGQEPVSRARACVVAGYSPRASTFSVYIGQLKGRGLVETLPGALRLTGAGLALARAPLLARRQDLITSARAMLKPAEQRVLDALLVLEKRGGAVARADLAGAVGLSTTASTLGVYLGAIGAIGLLENASPGKVRLAAWVLEVPE